MGPHHYSDQALRRIQLFSAVFIVIGLCFTIHGGLNLFEIYNRPVSMFAMDEGFSPEKGRGWSELLAGMSVCLTGILMCIKAGIDLKKRKNLE